MTAAPRRAGRHRNRPGNGFSTRGRSSRPRARPGVRPAPSCRPRAALQGRCSESPRRGSVYTNGSHSDKLLKWPGSPRRESRWRRPTRSVACRRARSQVPGLLAAHRQQGSRRQSRRVPALRAPLQAVGDRAAVDAVRRRLHGPRRRSRVHRPARVFRFETLQDAASACAPPHSTTPDHGHGHA